MLGLGLSPTKMSPVLAEKPSAFTGNWWKGPWYGRSEPALGAGECVAAYQAKWAVNTIYQRSDTPSFNNSKVNIENPGVHDLTAAIAWPDWEAEDGWTGDGLTQVLTTDIVGAVPPAQSMIVAFANLWAGINSLIGARSTVGGTTQSYTLTEQVKVVGLHVLFYRNCLGMNGTTIHTSGVLGINQTRAFRAMHPSHEDPVEYGSLADIGENNQVVNLITIFAENINGVPTNLTKGNIVAAALYNVSLTTNQMIEIMRALQSILEA